MNIIEYETRNLALIEKLSSIWQNSVRATHAFLTEYNINMIAQFVPGAIKDISSLVVVEDPDGQPVGFAGVEGNKLEMLFLHSDYIGCGMGKQLMRYLIQEHDVNEVCVNEQNPKAKSFYEHMGFKVYKREEFDEQGNPFPILYMKL